MAVEEAMTVDGEGSAVSAHTIIELNEQGQVVRIQYPDQSMRFFGYDADGGVNRIEDESGRASVRNDDYSWSTTNRAGRNLGTTEKAYVTVSRDGNLVWGYYKTGTIVIQRTDCSALKTSNNGALLEYISPFRRKFTVTDGGKAAECLIGDEDSPEELAIDSLRVQHWELIHYVPTKERVAKELWCLLRDNGISDPENLEPGAVIRVPLPQL
jgi:hypothetical protein